VSITQSETEYIKFKFARVPYLEEEAFQWYQSFDSLGELIKNPNPTLALELLLDVVGHFAEGERWPAHRIHIFGFGQGGTVAAEFGIAWWKKELNKGLESAIAGNAKHVFRPPPRPLGSIVTIGGPLLSFPTPAKLCQTPILVYHRTPPSDMEMSIDDITSFQRGYEHVLERKMQGGTGMPQSKTEWEPIMRFWSARLGKARKTDLYEVLTSSIF